MNVDEKIRRAVEKATQGPVAHLRSHPVVESFDRQIAWEGMVEEFCTLQGRMFAWGVNHGTGEPEYVTVLSKAPVDSAKAAVRAWIASRTER